MTVMYAYRHKSV